MVFMKPENSSEKKDTNGKYYEQELTVIVAFDN